MPVPVDMLDAANAWGLRHMAGNVVEKTMSCWSDLQLDLNTSSAYLADAQQAESCGRAIGGSIVGGRVVKGGAFGVSSEYARPANRGFASETSRTTTGGFRIVREM